MEIVNHGMYIVLLTSKAFVQNHFYLLQFFVLVAAVVIAAASALWHNFQYSMEHIKNELWINGTLREPCENFILPTRNG